MNSRLILAICALCVGLIACGPAQPGLSPLSRDAKILAFGDSLTKGSGADPDASYPAALARLSGRAVVNAGLPGELSADGLKRLPRVLDSVRPQLMILCHGGNDMLHKKDLKMAARNIQSMIELARARDIEVLLIGVPKPGLFLGTASFYPAIAEANGIPAELDILAEILAHPSLKSDAVHPNGEGYKRMAEAIVAVLKDTGAL